MSEPFLGTIMPVGFQFAPSGWMTCQGQSLPISQYNAVFALLGTTFGGNGQTTFGLPNLQGRTLVGQGTSGGIVYQAGVAAGATSATLTPNQLPAHNHPAQATVTAGSGYVAPSLKAAAANAVEATPSATNNVLGIVTDTAGSGATPAIYAPANSPATIPLGGFNPGTAATPNVTIAVGNTGASAPVSLMQPYLAIYYVIALQGIFPTRD
jgi:microcystin-dependent protein